ncbi:hypothetical protein D3C78_1262540 [compost metagenome]
MWKQGRHLLTALQVELSGVHLETVLVFNGLACSNTNQNILYLGIAFTQIMDIICCHQADSCLSGKVQKLNIYFFLLGQAMVLKL